MSFKKILGIEFSKPLVEIAETNRRKLNSENMVFLHVDATEFRLPAGNNMVFMFNPFDHVVLEQFVRNNMNHFKENKSILAYENDIHRHSLTALGFEVVFRNHERKISLHRYRNPSPAPFESAPPCQT